MAEAGELIGNEAETDGEELNGHHFGEMSLPTEEEIERENASEENINTEEGDDSSKEEGNDDSATQEKEEE